MATNQKMILLVDDSRVNLQIGLNSLAGIYAVLTAPSAEKMFHILENTRPDLILLDIDMPETCGFEAIKILKSKQEIKDIPVIFLTSRSDPYDEFKGLSLGAVDYITKPYDPKLLRRRVKTCLGC